MVPSLWHGRSAQRTPLALSKLGINNNHRLLGLREMILLDKPIRKHLWSRFIFNIMWPIVVPIEWWVQFVGLNNLRIMQLQYFRDLLVEIEIIAIDIPPNYVDASTIGFVLHNDLCHEHIYWASIYSTRSWSICLSLIFSTT